MMHLIIKLPSTHPTRGSPSGWREEKSSWIPTAKDTRAAILNKTIIMKK